MLRWIAKYEKYASWCFFFLMLACLIPMAVLGLFNHPAGDDYYYGSSAALVWQETGNIFKVLSTALSGAMEQYVIWQGSYSAMFLMYLPPFIWGNILYKLYPAVLFVCFAGSIFYLTRVLLCEVAGASKDAWRLVASLLVLLCVEQVPLCGETFYWYNGSMYYTGFLACTLFFFGLLLRTLRLPSVKNTVWLCILALFIAGGNYISLLPAWLFLALLVGCYLYRVLGKKEPQKRQLCLFCIVFFCLCAGFLINVLAPGNAVRQSVSWKSTPIKAILKSIYYNSKYCLVWNGIWSFLFFIFVTPSYLGILAKSKFTFRYPVAVCGMLYGIYCSSSCPTFYAQNNNGAARVFCLVYYLMILTQAAIYFYALGAVWRGMERKGSRKECAEKGMRAAESGERKGSRKECAGFGRLIGAELAVAVIFVGMSFLRPWHEAYVKPHSLTAMQVLQNGEAAYYESQYQERLRLLEDTEQKDVILEPYDVPAALESFLYLGDISEDETHQVNQHIAAIYHKNSVRLP